MIPSAKAALGRVLGRWLHSERRCRRHTRLPERVLRGSIELLVLADSEAVAAEAERAALDELRRLEAIFCGHTPSSEIWRLQATVGVDVPVSIELAEVLHAAELWRQRTGGAFNPAVDAVTRIWVSHAGRNLSVDEAACAELARALDTPLWTVDRRRGTARRLTGFPVTLDAIAKGYIIDAASVRAARLEGVGEVMVNVGGDLRHIGREPVAVPIENPFGVDGADPVDVVRIRNQGLATNGRYRRGFPVGDHWFSHVIDPRSARPTTSLVCAAVIADDAATADVLAAALSVLSVEESLALADSLPRVGCLLVGEDGTRVANGRWRAQSARRF